jgi:hypothetical protein
LAFLLIVVGFFAELFFQLKVSTQMFDAIVYIVLGGLGFTASEKFVNKDKK